MVISDLSPDCARGAALLIFLAMASSVPGSPAASGRQSVPASLSASGRQSASLRASPVRSSAAPTPPDQALLSSKPPAVTASTLAVSSSAVVVPPASVSSSSSGLVAAPSTSMGSGSAPLVSLTSADAEPAYVAELWDLVGEVAALPDPPSSVVAAVENAMVSVRQALDDPDGTLGSPVSSAGVAAQIEAAVASVNMSPLVLTFLRCLLTVPTLLCASREAILIVN
jgi:hypothetical protein